MNLIEQAAQRLEQLRQAGVDIPPPSAQRVSEPRIEQLPPQVHPDNSLPLAKTVEQETLQSPEMAISRRVELDNEALSAAGIIRPDAPRSQLADEFRVIKRPLIDNGMERGASRINDGNLIMITSALPEEGKTFTAANLAMSIAMELDN